ncbi:hypothetical protein [Brackiella oedipodis]|uniref:hypothetical protein n=1 Tax=Brackiella oedipodis TaxID=124225 RepID=UPI00048B64CE|nr:hypothetical protein [Brackiella oedipodis]
MTIANCFSIQSLPLQLAFCRHQGDCYIQLALNKHCTAHLNAQVQLLRANPQQLQSLLHGSAIQARHSKLYQTLRQALISYEITDIHAAMAMIAQQLESLLQILQALDLLSTQAYASRHLKKVHNGDLLAA